MSFRRLFYVRIVFEIGHVPVNYRSVYAANVYKLNQNCPVYALAYMIALNDGVSDNF